MNAQTVIPKNEFEEDLAKLIVTALNLDLSPTEINPDAPLYGDEGLGIDSIDILEISLALSKQYGIQLRADDENSKQIFASLRNLGTYIQANRTK
jgi:acyl carrier protein